MRILHILLHKLPSSAYFHFILSKFDEILKTLYVGCPFHSCFMWRSYIFNVSSLYDATSYLVMYYGHVGVPNKANLFLLRGSVHRNITHPHCHSRFSIIAWTATCNHPKSALTATCHSRFSISIFIVCFWTRKLCLLNLNTVNIF